MIKRIWSLVFGRCRVECGLAYGDKLIEIIRDGGYTSDAVRCEGDMYTVTVPEGRIRAFRRRLDAEGIEYTATRMAGIPKLVAKYRRRSGIVIGAVLFFVAIELSGKVIWDFEVTGNVTIPDSEIIAALESNGCRAGSIISDIDFDMLQNDCLIDADRLAWVSVNMDGNLARVEVREKRTVPIEYVPEKGRFANVVAAEDGVVELCFVKNGKSMVENGDVVKRGELLIAGVIDVGEDAVRYEYADGEVMARVYREIESYVPYSRTEKAPTGRKKTEFSLKIFGKAINLSPRGSIEWDLYGKIKEEEKLSLPFGIALPVRICKTVYSEETERTVIADEAEALRLAREEARRDLAETSASLEVLSVSERTETDGDGVRLVLGVYGITDISANLGFAASEENTVTEKE